MSVELDAVLATAANEIGVSARLENPTRPPEWLPPVLADFYRRTNGLSLPFLEVWPVDQIRRTDLPGWLLFGADRYFSFCVCKASETSEPPLELWDHEGDAPPEGVYESVADLIAAAYDELFEEHRERQCRVIVHNVPTDAPLPRVVAAVKSLTHASSGEILQKLRAAPATFDSDSPHAGIKLVRTLLREGVRCHLDGAA